MRATLLIAGLLGSAVLAFCAEVPPDLTGASADSFKAHIGKVITLRGRLEQGVQGPCLLGASPTNVSFYIIPDIHPTGGSLIPRFGSG